MKLCRFIPAANSQEAPGIGPHLGLVTEQDQVVDLTLAGCPDLESVLEHPDPVALLQGFAQPDLATCPVAEVRLLAPIQQAEVWAAGVTYQRSKHARMDESDFSANAYDRVYDAERPELFFKALPEKVVGPGAPIGIRQDSQWNVPEPELALVVNSRGALVGYTVGNDVSSRDIEGENLLYLPQAKIYRQSCALGPWLILGVDEPEARGWNIALEIVRGNATAFRGETQVTQIKRSFTDLVKFLYRCQTFPHGTVLLTGTGVVPPSDFTLQPADLVRITISGIGRLENPVVQV